MPASSSSSSSAAASTFKVTLYDANFTKVADVDVPVPMPNLVKYQGLEYVWSNVHWAYFVTTAYNATTDINSPALSVLSNPQQ